ncbi:MAG: dUTP diphosphatase [Desulfonatronovibrio sp. MSAO_Bac4]|nr:MAG: dUTP diphosphatase [Desulfonatronovibrio sp. MSAO_Bac4]
MIQNNIQVKVKYLRQTRDLGNSLKYATENSAGIDLRAFMKSEQIILKPGERYPFPTGICIEITTPGIAGFVFSRSGLGTKKGVAVSQGVGVIDPDYRGEIIVSLLNNSPENQIISRSQRIAQLVFLPFYHAEIMEASELSQTSRGAGGFGHTGNT